jgi:DNA-binding winged helix-turn-helix (wHTH) protein/Tol biopolymer transport system component
MSPKSLPELPAKIRFAAFELDPRAGVLRKYGIRIRLQDQPFRVLLALLERPGEVVTREQLRERIWEGTEFGDFDHRLNIAVNKIREVLGDSRSSPRYIETVPRRGYRFMAAVEGDTARLTPAPLEIVPPATKRRKGWVLPGAIVAVALVLAGIALVKSRPESPRPLQIHRLTSDNSPKLGPVLSDGARLYFMAGSQFDSYLAQIPLSGGEPVRLPVTLPAGRYINLLDIAPDHQELLLSASDRPTWSLHAQEPAPLWTLRIADGSTRRLGALVAHEARYSPDGRQIAFVMIRPFSPGSLWIASVDGSTPHALLELRGLDILAPFWSPDGSRIIFCERDQRTQVESTWEMKASGSGLRQLFPDWHKTQRPAGWAPDGSLLISSEGRLWTGVPRRLFQTAPILPTPISPDEPRFESIVAAAGQNIMHGIGTTPLGQLQRFELARHRWETHLGGISAEMVEYSPDGARIAYVTYPERELWTRRADGSEPVRLTNNPMQGSLPRWSPDGTLLGFLGNNTPVNPVWQIYLVSATGGTPRLACRQNCGLEGDFNWTPDGKRIIYDSARASLWSLEVSTGTATKMPGTDGLYSPRSSPDGSMLAALNWRSDSDQLTVLRFAAGRWKRTADTTGFIKWPYWSRDSRFVWYLNAVKGTIARYDVVHDQHEDVVPIKMEQLTGRVGTWFALTPTEEPMILRRRDIQQVYALNSNAP